MAVGQLSYNRVNADGLEGDKSSETEAIMRRGIALAITVHVAPALLTIGTGHAVLLRRTDFRLGNPNLWILALSLAVVATWLLAGRGAAEGPGVWRLWRRPDRHDLIMVVSFAVLALSSSARSSAPAVTGGTTFLQVRSIV